MTYDFKPFGKRVADIVERLGKELAGVRTGRATPAILDGVTVESFGSWGYRSGVMKRVFGSFSPSLPPSGALCC